MYAIRIGKLMANKEDDEWPFCRKVYLEVDGKTVLTDMFSVKTAIADRQALATFSSAFRNSIIEAIDEAEVSFE